MLTADHYTNPRWLPIEQQAIFRRAWLYVGDGERLNQPGMVWARSVAGTPLLIVRDNDGELRAFYNVCPHRAAILSPQVGIHSCQRLVCPYHAWVYDLAGDLVGVPSQDQFPDSFQKPDFALRSVRLETWSGFMFVCFDDTAPPLAEFLGSIPEYLGRHRTAATQRLVAKQYTVGCNWKNYHDNTLCDYHVAIAHRTTLNPIQGPIRRYRHQLETFVNLLYTPITADWQAENSVLPTLQGRSREGFFTYGIYPNLHLLGLPNGLLIWLRIEPLAAASCQVALEIYGDPEYCPPAETLLTDFEAFMQEDMVITESVQQGYASGVYTPGPVNGLEARIIHQQQLIWKALTAAGGAE
ncbi:aromatic ring-hydroxylating dioxygenase subunit alpha [Nodosilinea sp. LEGE 07088]|nr:aromatic ring-hydroxylating dioxygenase subunit alpha [Nodosilinea sp. LEGE 07088]